MINKENKEYIYVKMTANCKSIGRPIYDIIDLRYCFFDDKTSSGTVSKDLININCNTIKRKISDLDFNNSLKDYLYFNYLNLVYEVKRL